MCQGWILLPWLNKLHFETDIFSNTCGSTPLRREQFKNQLRKLGNLTYGWDARRIHGHPIGDDSNICDYWPIDPTSGFLGTQKFPTLKTFSTPKTNNLEKRTSSQKPIDHAQTRQSTVLPSLQLPYPDHPKQQQKTEQKWRNSTCWSAVSCVCWCGVMSFT